jgi:lysylphosphatidylglycerol synthetase-like protein (DUF2156 family)
MIDRQASIALLREELEQQRTRAEAAEAELRELRRVVDAWQAADNAARANAFAGGEEREAREALRHA